MNVKRQQRRDDFAFSLRGFTVVSSLGMPIAISDERFRKVRKSEQPNHHNSTTSHNWAPAPQAGC